MFRGRFQVPNMYWRVWKKIPDSRWHDWPEEPIEEITQWKRSSKQQQNVNHMHVYIGELSAPRAKTVTSVLVSARGPVTVSFVCTIYFPPCVIYIQYIHIGGIGTWPSYSIAIIPDWALAHVQPSSYHNTIPRSALKIENSAIVYLYCSFNCASVRC